MFEDIKFWIRNNILSDRRDHNSAELLRSALYRMLSGIEEVVRDGAKLTNLTDVEADEIPNTQFLVGRNGKAIFRKIEFSDLNGNEIELRTSGIAVPVWNHDTKNWTSGRDVSSYLWDGNSMNGHTVVIRNSNGRFQSNFGESDYDVAVVGQIPYKLFNNNGEMQMYLENQFISYGQLAFNRENGKLYIVNNENSFKAILDEDGNVGKLTNLTDVEADEIPNTQFLVGRNGKAIFRKIEFADLNGNEIALRTSGTAVPAWNYTTKNWTSGYVVSSSLWTGNTMNRNTLVLRDSNGRFQSNFGQADYDVAVVGQIPYKLFNNDGEMQAYLDNQFMSYGQLAFNRQNGKLYIVNDDENSFKAILDEDGNVSSFLDLSDTPRNYSNAGGKFLKVKSLADGVEYQFLNGSDFKLKNDGFEYLPIWSGSEWKESGYIVSNEEIGSTIALRKKNGRLAVASAVDENEAVNLGQITELLSEIGVDNIHAEIENRNYPIVKGNGNNLQELETGDLVFNAWVGGNLETILMWNGTSWNEIGQTIEF